MAEVNGVELAVRVVLELLVDPSGPSALGVVAQ
jgi:hypothetical protein